MSWCQKSYHEKINPTKGIWHWTPAGDISILTSVSIHLSFRSSRRWYAWMTSSNSPQSVANCHATIKTNKLSHKSKQTNCHTTIKTKSPKNQNKPSYAELSWSHRIAWVANCHAVKNISWACYIFFLFFSTFLRLQPNCECPKSADNCACGQLRRFRFWKLEIKWECKPLQSLSDGSEGFIVRT